MALSCRLRYCVELVFKMIDVFHLARYITTGWRGGAAYWLINKTFTLRIGLLQIRNALKNATKKQKMSLGAVFLP